MSVEHTCRAKARTRRDLVRIALVLGTMTIGLLLVAQVGEAAPSPFRIGTAGTATEVLPTVMARWDTHVEDLDGDGSMEKLVLSGDGVVQRYDGTDLRWSTGTQDLATHLGLVADNGAHYVTNARHLLPTSAHSVVFTDANGDGIKDILALNYLAVDQPVAELEGAVVTIDGANGQILKIDRYGGYLHHMVLADFDGDGSDELLLVEEDGPRHLNVAESHFIGTDNHTRAFVQELDGTLLWEQTGAAWSQVTAIALATLDADGPDLIVADTQGFDSFENDLDMMSTHFTQKVRGIDGATGSILWSTQVDDYVREIEVGDVDGDSIDDAVLRVMEPANSFVSRGDDRAYVQALSGLDGSTGWTLKGMLGNTPTVHDIILREAGMQSVAVAYSNDAGASYSAEELAHVALFKLTDGSSLAQVRLGESFLSELTAVDSLFGMVRPERPSLLSDIPDITKMRLTLAHVDGDNLVDVVVGTDRAITGLQVSGSDLVAAWREETPADRDVFFTQSSAGTDIVWTNDWSTARLKALRANTGAAADGVPLVGISPGLERVDLTGDGAKDRVIGGSSQTVFAFKAGTDSLLWKRELGAYVTDIASDDLDGDGDNDLLVVGELVVWGLDGQSGSVLWTHEHRFQDSGGSFRDVEFRDMDDDGKKDVLLGHRTSRNGGGSPDGLAEVLVLSGATGEPVWRHTLPQPITSVNGLALGDVNGDAVPEVAFTTGTYAAGLYYGVGVLDGATGLPLWRIDTVEGPGKYTLPKDGIVFADADGDKDLDVIVAVRGGDLYKATLRAHDGTTGLLLWEKPIDVDDNGGLFNTGLLTGGVGPAGAQALVALTQDAAIDGTRVTVMTPQGAVHYVQNYPGMALITDTATGDVDGDGIEDVVLAGPQGLVVLDSGPTLGGNPSHIGHMARWSTSAIELNDLDGDGTLEIEFGTDQQTQPIALGQMRISDLARGKAVGRIDMDAILPPPTNLPPVAEFFQVDGGPVVEGGNATLRSLSFDPDGSIVTETWTLPNGTQVSGHEVVVDFPAPGEQKVRLDVMDNEGAVDSYIGTIQVSPLYGFNVTLDRIGSYATPGELLSFNMTVENVGARNDTFTPAVDDVFSGWNATVLDPAPATLEPGANHTYVVEVSVNVPTQRAHAELSVRSNHTGVSKAVTHQVLVPIAIDATLGSGRGPYMATEDVVGHARFSWYDGSPVTDMLVNVQTLGSIQSEELYRTDSNGEMEFEVKKEFGAVHQPGTWTVEVTPDLDGYGVRKLLNYKVQPVPGMDSPNLPKLGPIVGEVPSTGL